MNNKIFIGLLLCILIAVSVFIYFKTISKSNLKISFYDNGSTGFSWKYTVSEEDIVQIDGQTDYSKCNASSDGCGGKMIYTIKPLKAGKVTVTFEWSSYSGIVDKNAIYDIEITDDLKIKESHTGSYFD